jgi:hypothetical protein
MSRKLYKLLTSWYFCGDLFLYHPQGVVEYWVVKAKNCLFYSSKTITPVLQYSDWGQAPKFVSPA